MSGWTVLTVRGKRAEDYEYTREDTPDRWDATSDIVATMDADKCIRRWTTWSGHVYAYLVSGRYDFDFAEDVLAEYGEMVDDAVVLGANDTTDQGTARYYHRPAVGAWSDQVEETDCCHVGEVALSTINSRHNIVARDPFHNQSGSLDDRYLEDGSERSSDTNAEQDEPNPVNPDDPIFDPTTFSSGNTDTSERIDDVLYKKTLPESEEENEGDDIANRAHRVLDAFEDTMEEHVTDPHTKDVFFCYTYALLEELEVDV